MKALPADLADALEALLGGRMTPAGCRRAHPIRTASSEIEPILDNIKHFLSDAAIRAPDPPYRVMQESAIERLIIALRSGDVDAAGRISLLDC
jgi:hypothetical protein